MYKVCDRELHRVIYMCKEVLASYAVDHYEDSVYLCVGGNTYSRWEGREILIALLRGLI